MAKIHDKFVIELAEVIKGYGNDPDVDDPFCLSEFYRFYELPEIAVSETHFKTMIPLEVEKAKGCKTGRWVYHVDDAFPADSTQECNQCHAEQPLTCDDEFCPHCGARMEGDDPT